jgi:hypothetical protein
VFFVPGEMLIDPKYTKVLATQLKSSGLINPSASDKDTAGRVAEALAHYEYARSEAEVSTDDVSKTESGDAPRSVLKINGLGISTAKSNSDTARKTNITTTSSTAGTSILNQDDLVILELLQKASLNNVSVVVGGIMTVDTNSIPAVLNDVTFTDENIPATWSTVPSTLKGSITGSYLTDGKITISPATEIGAITTDPDSSSDKNLAFSLPLTAAIAPGTKLTFTVTKVAKDKSSVISKPYTYTVPTPPAITAVTPDSEHAAATWAGTNAITGKITGTRLTDGKPAADNNLACKAVNSDANNDTTLSFSCTRTAAIAVGTKINFTVATKTKDGATVTSAPYSYTVTTSQ